jgi:hypothetical protein
MGEPRHMRPKYLILRDCQGKGLFGCLVSLVLMAVAIFLAIKLGPMYYANYNLEADVETEASRAGARFLDNDTIINDILVMAKKNEIKLTKENVSVERFAGQIHIEIRYAVPADFVFFERNMNFEISASSFIGTL